MNLKVRNLYPFVANFPAKAGILLVNHLIQGAKLLKLELKCRSKIDFGERFSNTFDKMMIIFAFDRSFSK